MSSSIHENKNKNKKKKKKKIEMAKGRGAQKQILYNDDCNHIVNDDNLLFQLLPLTFGTFTVSLHQSIKGFRDRENNCVVEIMY